MSQTIDTIFLSHAEKKADDLSITDSANRERLGLNSIDELTYKQSARYIRHTAAFLRQAQFADGDIVVVQLPNIAETPLILLAILNAGLVPCLIPSHWRKVEIEAALQKLNPRAIIAHQAVLDHNPFETMFEIAAAHTSIRFIYGLGNNLTDGVTPLPDLTTTITTDITADESPEVLITRSGEQVAFIGWTRSCVDAETSLVDPVAYTHIQLMANAHIVSSEIKLQSAPKILSTYAPTNLTGLVTTLLPWILEAGTLHIAGSLKIAPIITRIKEHNINLTVIPQSLGEKLDKAFLQSFSVVAQHPHLALVSPTPYKLPEKLPKVKLNAQETHIYNLNGLCIYAQHKHKNRDDQIIQIGEICLGSQPGTNGEELNPPFIETRIQGAAQKAGDENETLKGRLELNGMAVGFTDWQPVMTTTQLSNFDTHWEKSNLAVKIIDQGMTMLKVTPSRDEIYYGSALLNGTELDKIYQQYPGFVDAAAFSIKDPALGERLFAAIIPSPEETLSYEEFKQFLLDQQISPAKIPEKLVTVEEIPRSAEGFIERQAILNFG
jgi:acyl-CoA synthetase (AMP-forming)/AMP-acid ligase II